MIKKFLAALLAFLAAAAFAAVDVNKATQADLESIKGIGPVIATKIMDERKKGSFKDWNDMVTRVKGIGDGNAAKFSADGLTVNGSTFSGAPAAGMKTAEKASTKAEARPSAASADSATSKTTRTTVKTTEPMAASAANATKPTATASAADARNSRADAKAAKAEAKAARAEAKADAKVEKAADKRAAASAAKPAASAASAKK